MASAHAVAAEPRHAARAVVGVILVGLVIMAALGAPLSDSILASRTAPWNRIRYCGVDKPSGDFLGRRIRLHSPTRPISPMSAARARSRWPQSWPPRWRSRHRGGIYRGRLPICRQGCHWRRRAEGGGRTAGLGQSGSAPTKSSARWRSSPLSVFGFSIGARSRSIRCANR